MASLDAQQYAEALRKSLMEDLFNGEELDDDDSSDQQQSSLALQGMEDSSQAQQQLSALETELEEFAGHEVIRAILEQGVVIQQHSADVGGRLRALELESIQDYIAESDNLVALHEQIKHCDSILEHMEGLLGKFQTDLGQVSEEIRALQVQSATMSTKLRNRRALEDRLGSFLEQLVVSEDLISSVLDSEVSEEYLEHLLVLARKIAFINSNEAVKHSQARRDVEAVLEKLRNRAIAKVRDFLLSKLYQLRKPKTNISIIQQNSLLKYKYFVRFLAEHGPDVHAELRAEYVSVMSRVLAGHFKTYLGALERMVTPAAGQADVLGLAEAPSGAMGSVASGVGGMMSLFSKATAGRGANTERAFELGERLDVLSQVSQPAIIPHMAEFEGKRFPYEVIFRNVHKLLVDTASSEFLFCLDFWEEEAAFRELFAPVVAVVEGDLAEQLQNQHDVLCVLLMIRLNSEHRSLMARRRVPCLDDYLDRLNLALWPRFKVLFDVQASSIRPGVERSLFTGQVEVNALTRRYAAFAASCLTLMADHDSDDSIFKASSFYEMLERLWASIFDTLLRMSNMFKDRRQGIIFLILNYNHIKTTLRAADSSVAQRISSGSGGKGSQQQQQQQQQSAPGAAAGGLGSAGAAAIKECEDQLAACTSLYVEDQLGSHFKALLDFVKKAEQVQKRGGVQEGQPITGFTPAEAAPVLRDFGGRWKGSIEAMHKEVLGQVAEPGCAREVLQASMTQLLLYYTRMLELLKRQGPEGGQLAREVVNIPAIMYEIKRLTKA
uniref:Uncharacterized protein n=1 Tax=Tetradesmus obliquus TaxID=3088 RepID=A0A383VE33_TETOB|eukprot:jgi/Sobl393_1/15893/SZX63808.1